MFGTHRTWIGSLAASALMALVCVSPAWCINHLIIISEVYSNDDGSIQFVELLAEANGQTALSPTSLVAYDADGEGATTIYDFTMSFSALGVGETILLATDGFEDEFGIEPDFIIPDGSLYLESGRVVFAHSSPCAGILDCEIDAVAYGDFKGDNNRFGPAADALPSDNCSSLTATSDAQDSDDRFEVELGNPVNNDGDDATAVCPEYAPFSMNIGEVYSSVDGTLQYVELIAGADHESLLSKVSLLALNADGTTETVVFDFTEDFPDLASGQTLLLATKAAETTLGFAGDYLIADGSLPTGSGRLALEVDAADCGKLANCEIDAIAYGDFTGDNLAFGSPAEALPADECTALVRLSDTSDNSVDIGTAIGTPTRNDSETVTLTCPPVLVPFIRGDLSSDGTVGLGDAIGLLQYMFVDGSVVCAEAGDIDNSGGLSLSDPIGLLNFLFLSGNSPTEPFPDCGEDDDYALGCESFPECK